MRAVIRTRLCSCVFAALIGLSAATDATADVEVQIEGLAPELERNVRAFLSITKLNEELEQQESESNGSAATAPREGLSEARVRRMHSAARGEIATALQPFGYYDPSVEASLERSGEDWTAHYRVNPGRRTLLSTVDIRAIGEGSETPEVRTALESITLAPGMALSHPQYQQAKGALFDAAYNSGYIDARYQRAELRVNRETRSAEIRLVLDTGPRYYFGDIAIRQDILDDDFVQRFVTIEPGEPFDPDRLVDLQIMLNNSGYFADVGIDVEREQAENQRIPVSVYTTPRRTQEFTVGLGYGTDTGPRVSLGMELRRLNRRGHRFNTDLRLSGIEQAVAAEYRIPARNVATDFLSFRGSLGSEQIGDWDSNKLSLGATWNDRWFGMQRRIYFSGDREDFSTDLTESVRADAVYAGMQLTGGESDDPLYPRRGYSWSSDLRAGSDALGSSTSFARWHGTANYVRAFGDRLRLLVRGEYGAIDADEFSRLPPSQRFYAGGDRSVRGYGYQDLSPLDPNGASIGGRYLLLGSAELEVLLVGDYGIALFADAGNASNDALPSLKTGVGIGMRWRSPIGVVGIDVAHPLDDPNTDFRIHLSVGGDL
jgi:translocation and assembly module TamA